MKATIGFALSAIVAISGCDGIVAGIGPSIKGSGVTKEEKRKVAPFHEIEVSSTFEATVTIGQDPSVTLSVDDNLLPLVKTEVKAGRLQVGFAPGSLVLSSKAPKVIVVVPALDWISAKGASKVDAKVGEQQAIEINADGASTIDLKGISAESIKLSVDGASRVVLAGKAKRATLNLSGATKLLANEAEFEAVTVNIDGASKGEIHVTQSIEGKLDGASSLTLRGNPPSKSVKTSGASRLTD